jgi:hypothetical protein
VARQRGEPIDPEAALARLADAEHILAEVAEVAQVAGVLHLAETARLWAVLTRRGTAAINYAVIVKLRAAVKLADLVDAGQAEGSIAGPGDRANIRGANVSTLADLGLSAPRLAEYRKLRDEYGARDLVGLTAHAAEIDETLSWAELLRRAGPGPHVGQNTGVSEWYTPAEFIAAAVEVLGAIDLDPASTAEANDKVGAARFYTADDNGLDPERPWAGRVWMNPPYSQPAVAHFALRLAGEFTAGNVTAAITLTNNATDTEWWQLLAATASALCLPVRRVKFWQPGQPDASPLQGQALLYLGPYPGQFSAEFGRFGSVWEHDPA